MINIEALKDFSRVRKYKNGTIFSRDGSGTEMFVVLQGQVAVINCRDNNVIDTVEPFELFDASLVLSDKRIHITSKAITDVIALPISGTDIVSFIADEPKMIFELMKALYERFEKISSDYEEVTGHRWVESKPIIANKDAETPNIQNKCDEATAESLGAVPQAIEPQIGETQIDMPPVDFRLFPDGHTGEYKLALKNESTNLCEIDYKCPVCGNKFKGLKILSSRLGAATTDNDTRKHYKDFEPVYYEVITCTHCLYSALDNAFEKAQDIEASFIEELKELKKTVNFNFGTKPDTASIFAGYYLALLCAPNCFPKAQLMQAKLLQKLCWLYQDCKDEQMEMDLAKQALDKYMKAYMELDLSAAGEVQLFMIIGELNAKLGNIKEARSYYHKAKTNTQISAVLKKQAESRFEELKEHEQDNKKNEGAEKNTIAKGLGFLHR